MSLCHRMLNVSSYCRAVPKSSIQTPLTRSYATASASEVAAAAKYPYGKAYWYKQSNKGLYGGQTIQFGNNVSDKNEIKTRRHWSPNIKQKHLFSRALGKTVQVRVSTRVLRTIDKVGGLDEYLLAGTTSRIKDLGVHGWRLRCQVMASRKMQTEYNIQREELGLPPIDYSDVTNEALAAGVSTALSRTTDAGRTRKRVIRRTI